MGITLGAGGMLLRSRSLSLRAKPNSTLIESIAFNPEPTRWFRWALPAAAPPLTVPPPVIPQPLPPDLAWPEPPIVFNQPSFVDVSVDHWVYPVLSDLAQRQLVAGFPDGSFRPAAPMTRAEFATQLARLFDFSPLAEGNHYADLTPNHWAHQNIQKALQMRFLTGYPDQTFQPDQTITRIQVLAALANGLSLKSSRSPDTVLKRYSDYQQVPSWAKPALVAALEADLVINFPDPVQLEPNRLANRAEVMAMMHQALVYTGKLPALAAPGSVVYDPPMP
jgi:hypothetical protein